MPTEPVQKSTGDWVPAMWCSVHDMHPNDCFDIHNPSASMASRSRDCGRGFHYNCQDTDCKCPHHKAHEYRGWVDPETDVGFTCCLWPKDHPIHVNDPGQPSPVS